MSGNARRAIVLIQDGGAAGSVESFCVPVQPLAVSFSLPGPVDRPWSAIRRGAGQEGAGAQGDTPPRAGSVARVARGSRWREGSASFRAAWVNCLRGGETAESWSAATACWSRRGLGLRGRAAFGFQAGAGREGRGWGWACEGSQVLFLSRAEGSPISGTRGKGTSG